MFHAVKEAEQAVAYLEYHGGLMPKAEYQLYQKESEFSEIQNKALKELPSKKMKKSPSKNVRKI